MNETKLERGVLRRRRLVTLTESDVLCEPEIYGFPPQSLENEMNLW